MGRFDAVLKDPEYIKLNEVQKRQVWEGLFRKHVATDKDYLALDEARREEAYQGFIGKYYSPQQPEQPQQDIFEALKPVEPTAAPVESLRVPGVSYNTEKATAIRQKVMEARQKRDRIMAEIESGNAQSNVPISQAKDFVNINGMDVPRSEWNKLRLTVANADLQPNNYTDPVEFNVVKSMEQEERAAQSQREIQRLQKAMAETTDPDLVPIIGENLKKQELLNELYASGMTREEREGYALGKEQTDKGFGARLFGSFGKDGIDLLTLGMIPLFAPDSKVARYLQGYEQGTQAPTGRPLEDAFASLALSAPLSMGFFIGGLAPAAARTAINTAMSVNMLLNTQGRKYATAYARYGSATATPDAAIEGGALSAVLETAIETFSDVAQTDIVLGIMRKSGKKAAQNYVRKELSQTLSAKLNRFGMASLEAAGTEAAEELLQTAQDMVIDVATKQREVPTLQDAVKEIGQAALVGGLGGLTFGLLGGTVRPYTEYQNWRNVEKLSSDGNEAAKRLMDARKLIEGGKIDEAYTLIKDDLRAVKDGSYTETDENIQQAIGQVYDAYSMIGKVDNPAMELMSTLSEAIKLGVDEETAVSIIESKYDIDTVISELRAATDEIKAVEATNDNQDQAGIPSQEQGREAPIQTEPEQGTGTETPPASGVLQAQEEVVPEKSIYDSLSYAELQQENKRRGLSSFGIKKDVLIQQLIDNDTAKEQEQAKIEQDTKKSQELEPKIREIVESVKDTEDATAIDEAIGKLNKIYKDADPMSKSVISNHIKKLTAKKEKWNIKDLANENVKQSKPMPVGDVNKTDDTQSKEPQGQDTAQAAKQAEQPTPAEQPANNNDIKSIIDKIDSGEIAPILHIKGVANEISEMYKFVIDGVTYIIYPENMRTKRNISDGTIYIEMLVKASPEMDKLLSKYNGEAVKEAIYAVNPKGYAFPTFYSMSDAILFSRENPNIVKTNLAAYKERLKTTGIQDYTSTPTEPEQKTLTKAQQIIANQIKEQAKTEDEFNPEAFEKKLDKLADVLGNVTVSAKKTGSTITFNIDNVESGQKINIKATKDGYEIDGKTFPTDAKAYEYVATIAGETDARHKALTEGQAEAERQMDAVRKQYEGTDKWMKAPNGKPTKLNERQWLQVRTPNFLNWFGDWINDPKNASKVVDENGEPMVVYSGHSQAVLWGSQYNPKKSIAGAFYSSESPLIASGYAVGKLGDYREYVNGEQYRFPTKDGRYTKKLYSVELNDKQKALFDKLLAKDVPEYDDPSLAGIIKDTINNAKINAKYDATSRRLTYNIYNLANLFNQMESLGYNIVYDNTDNSSPDNRLPHALLQNQSYFEDLLDYLGIQWESAYYDKPAVFPLFMNVRNPIDAIEEFPQQMLTELEKIASRAREKDYQRDERWRKTYSLKEWVERIKDKDEGWTTQIPAKALPIIKSYGYDGVRELGLKGYTKEQRQVNWLSFDAEQIKSATANTGEFSAENADIRYKLTDLYHGSGAFFDRFDLNFIGTGEGAQAFGWGIYVTEREGVARDYAEKLGTPSDYTPPNPGYAADGMDDEYGNPYTYNSIYKAVKAAEEFYNHNVDWMDDDAVRDKIGRLVLEISNQLEVQEEEIEMPSFDEITEWVENSLQGEDSYIYYKEGEWGITTDVSEISSNVKFSYLEKDYLPDWIMWVDEFNAPEGSSRNLYTVSVWDNHTEDVIDWEGKITEQQESKIVEQAHKEKMPAIREALRVGRQVGNYYGKDAYRDIATLLKSPKAASEFLLRAGIDGIKYPVNALSGGKGEKGYNYVVFDANQISITHHERYKHLKKYSPTVDYQTANMVYKTETTSIEGITRAITSVIPKQWIKSIETEGESARITFMNGREILINAVTGAIADENGNPIAIGKTTINRAVGQGSNIIAIIDIAKNYNNGNITAYHEGFHLAFNLMLTEAEQAIVFQHYSGRMASELTQAERIAAEEMAAKDFEYLLKYGTPPVPAKVNNVLRRLWESIRNFVRKLMGKDFYDTNFQILERIAKGEADNFNYYARDYFNNPADEARYRKIKDPLEGIKVTEKQRAKAVGRIANLQDRGLDVSRKLAEFGVKVTIAYNKSKSEEKRQLLISQFANYLEQTLPLMPGFTRAEIATIIRNANKAKTLTSFMRILGKLESKLSRKYGSKLYPAMLTMLKASTKNAYQKDLLSRKRMVADEALEKLQYIRSVIAMSQEQVEAEMLRLSTLAEETEQNAEINIEAAQSTAMATEWKMRYLDMFSGLAREVVNKAGNKRMTYTGVERMATAYEEVRSLVQTGKSVLREREQQQKAEQTKLIRQTILALIGNKQFKSGLETKLEKGSKGRTLNPLKLAAEAAKQLNAKMLYLETIFEDMSIVAIYNHESMKEYRQAKEDEYNNAISEEEDEGKIKLMEFNRDQHLAAIDEMISVTQEHKDLFKNWFQETYFKPIYNAYRQRNAGMTLYTKIVHNMRAEVAKEIYGKEGLADYLPALMSSTLQNIKISLLDPQSGKRVVTRISMQQLGTMYAYSLNPEYADNVVNTGFDDVAMQQMQEIFAKSKAGRYMKRWVERVTYEFYPIYFDSINEVFKERNGYSLSRELIYTPAIMDVKDKLMMAEIGNPSFAAIESYGISLSSHIARVKNNIGFKLDALNFDAQLTNHIHQNEHYKAFAVPMFKARTTILSQPVLAAIDTVLGEPKRRALTSFYRDIAANGYVKQDVSNTLNMWMSNMAMAYLSFSPKVAVKQISSFAYAAAYMSPVEFVENVAWVLAHPVKVAKIMRKSPTFNIRYKEGITSEQYLYLHMGSASSFNRLFRQMINKTGNWSKYGDQTAAFIGGGAIYHREYVRLQKEHPDWSAAKLEDAAVTEMELFVDRTQQSAQTPFVPQLRREGSFWRITTQFKTQKFAMYNAIYNALSSAKVSRKNRKNQLAWMLAILFVVQPIMEWIGNIGFVEPESPWDVFLGGSLQLIEMIPMLGEIASGLVMWAVKGELPDYSRTIPAIGGLTSITRGLKEMDRAMKDYAEWGEIDLLPLVDGIANVAAPTTGMPIYPIVQEAKAISDFTTGEDERKARLLGYSKGLLDYSEKTYGKEQE